MWCYCLGDSLVSPRSSVVSRNPEEPSYLSAIRKVHFVFIYTMILCRESPTSGLASREQLVYVVQFVYWKATKRVLLIRITKISTLWTNNLRQNVV